MLWFLYIRQPDIFSAYFQSHPKIKYNPQEQKGTPRVLFFSNCLSPVFLQIWKLCYHKRKIIFLYSAAPVFSSGVVISYKRSYFVRFHFFSLTVFFSCCIFISILLYIKVKSFFLYYQRSVNDTRIYI